MQDKIQIKTKIEFTIKCKQNEQKLDETYVEPININDKTIKNETQRN